MRYIIYYILSLVSLVAISSIDSFAAPKGSEVEFTGAVSSAWNNVNNWNPKRVPTSGDDVVVPEGKRVVLDRGVTISTLTVNGTLEIVGDVTILVNRSNNSDKSDYIVINGNLVMNGGTLQAKSNGGSAKDNVEITANGSISGSGDIVGSNFVVDSGANLGDFIPGNKTTNPDLLRAVVNSRPSVIYINGTCSLVKGVKCDYAFKDAACTQPYVGAIDFSKRIYIVGGDVAIDAPTDISGTLVVNAGLRINAAVNLNGTGLKLEVNSGADVGIASAVSVKNGGEIVVNHRYDRSASLYVESGGSITPNKVTVNHTIKAGRTYYMGASTLDGEPTARDANVADKYYKYVAAQEEFVLADAGREFSEVHRTGSVWLKKGATSERTISENGALQIGDRVYSLSLSSGKEYGWNLLSNPFSTAINLSEEQFDFNPEEINPTIWCRVKQGGQYQFLTHSLATGVSTPGDSDGEWSGSFAPQQTFYVKAYVEGAHFTVKYPSAPIKGATLKSAKSEPKDVLRLSLASEEYNSDEVAFVFREGGEIGEAYGDAEKREETADYNSIYAIKGDSKCAIPFYPNVSELNGIELPLGVRLSSRSANGVVEALNIEEFAETAQAYLVDKKAQVVVDLLSSSRYEFESEAGVADEDRFVLVLANKSVDASVNGEEGVLTSVDGIVKNKTIVPLANGVIIRKGGESEALFRLYDISGRLVESVRVKEHHAFLLITKSGLYVAELNGKRGVERVKVLVR